MILSRREFLMISAGTALTVSFPTFATTGVKAKQATAITQVFGDGVRLTAIALEYDQSITNEQVNIKDFNVEGRTITDIFISDSIGLDKTNSGHFVIIQLSPDDTNLSLSEMIPMDNATVRPKPTDGGKPWVAGDKPASNLIFKDPKATIKTNQTELTTTSVKNLIVDDFQQLVFNDPETGKSLRYNLYIPKNHQDKPLPLVLFMHDAGVTSEFHRATLLQGLGAIAWASPEDQAKRPCFVLAPQFDEIIVDDKSQASPMLETTIHLIESLSKSYNIDKNRLYATGQSGGCMMTIAMNIKYPDLFAACFLVAGQWDPELVTPLTKKKLWILVSADDLGAFPGQNAITEKLEQEGAKISRDIWDARWTTDEYRFAYDKIIAESNTINYTVFAKDTVFLPGADKAGASGHRNTWRVAYTIEPIREWIFQQVKN
ncbi:PHB depolymerase family esterase [Pelistega ratti]|uniref:PHB depolymerase family esterase n=1 Tax=Pelistega ratti TaxID=2652177 RepID=UPI001FAAC3AF|nr:PHB depolymerase family esterase [Pelistega ratti]